MAETIRNNGDARPKARRAIDSMAPYRPPTGGRQELLRLDFNENTLGCSPKVREFLATSLNVGSLPAYPEYSETRPDLAAFFGVEEESLVLTNGTDEAIQVLVNTYLDDGQECLILQPAYAMYRFYAEVAGAEVFALDYNPDTLAFPLEQVLESISANTRLIMIANPNNPTGGAISLKAIEQILQRAGNAAVLIDEAYYEFCGVTALPLIKDYSNLFVSRTFSKVYGLAGLRIGCLFTQPANAALLRKGQSPYSVNAVAAAAARVAVQDQEFITGYVTEVLAARQLTEVGLEKLKIRYYPSDGNFILMDLGDRAERVVKGMRERGILVRDRGHEIPGAVRVTIGTRDQMDRFLVALREVLA
ncbi:MAG: histidinol-phosphate transaminase [Bryobacterales bacterium]|nr:histidinol-phosphate transaminase [Bryobacterales bacterium]